jgi:hypothetical protein
MVSQLIETLRRTLKEVEWAARFEGAEPQIADLQQQFVHTIAELEQLRGRRIATERGVE